jgi:POT family proton-dependent oligopeptide transporter|tara:strand:- start:2062 stop:3909 length:1848 start_codon:yes stop_codon:yes gene_type:complete
LSQEISTTPSDTSGMPTGIPYIIANEAAERFSFYGMKAILSIFMVQYLWLMGDAPTEQMSQIVASENYHKFNKWVYATPFLGALLADIFFGKYRIIMWLSVVYCVGHGCLAVMGISGSAGWWLFAGLALICLGSGGIKPCVSAHVGDQFGPNNQNLLTKVFNWFYFSINLGAFISMLATPWFLQWYGPHVAFGVPGILMALATFCFWLGRNKFIHIQPKPREFKRELFSKEGIGVILRLLPLYFFVAFFWALFDQTGSSWIFQSQDMDRHLIIDWLPSQIQSINSVLILTLVPLFTFVIYPALGKVIKLTPLRKIGAGLFITVLSFAVIALIQVSISNGATPNIGWQFFAYLILTCAEIMVSIVCLEYSYTQAPRNLKSFIMAIFLLSVSFGNQITEFVNSFIQVEDPVVTFAAELSDGEYAHPGFDNEMNTTDDIIVTRKEGKTTKRQLPDEETLDRAADIITLWSENNDLTLPTTAEALPLLSSLTDQWGSKITYTRLASRTARISSPGPDKKSGTQWDIGYIMGAPDKSAGSEKKSNRKTWLEKRKEQLGVVDEVTASTSPITKSTYTGGQPKLEGPAYYWFFTGLMLAAALLFVPYAILTKERSYLQSCDS